MVFTEPVRDRGGPGWTRRAVLGAGSAAVAGVASGCAWFDTDPPPPPPDPLEPLLTATGILAARYAATIADHPELAGRLTPLHEAHLAHVTALVQLIGRPELASPSTGPGGWSPPLGSSPSPGAPAASPGAPAASPDDRLAELRDAELAAGEEASAACLAAPPERAAVLGSITAARATHAEVLR